LVIIYPVNTSFPSTRANTIQILQTANALAAAGNEVHLIAKSGASDPTSIFDYYGISPVPSLHFHFVPAPVLFFGAKTHESLVLKRTIQVLTRFKSREKIVFTRDPLFAEILIKVRRLFRFRVAYEAHTLFFITAKETYMPIAWNKRKEARIRRREERVLSQADGIVFISSSLRDLVQENFPLNRPNTIVHDGTVIPPELSSNKNANTICYSGQFYWWKGMSTLVESLRWVNGAVLRLYGGEYATVKDDLALMNKVIKDHSLENKIEFRGFVAPAKIREEIQACEVGVLPLPNNIIANRCNSPLKLFDYMANGLAVVSSDLLTIREIIQHGENGHLVEAGNAEALAAGINTVLSNDDYRCKLITNAFTSVKQYSWGQRGIKLSEFLRTLKSQTKTSQ
jgi:glycosyltransferase involved in cell wall biosynthesis